MNKIILTLLLILSQHSNAQLISILSNEDITASKINQNFDFLKTLAGKSSIPYDNFEVGNEILKSQWQENFDDLAGQGNVLIDFDILNSSEINAKFLELETAINENLYDYVCEEMDYKIYDTQGSIEYQPGPGPNNFSFNVIGNLTYWEELINFPTGNSYIFWQGTRLPTTGFFNPTTNITFGQWTYYRSDIPYAQDSSIKTYGVRRERNNSTCNPSSFTEETRFVCYPKDQTNPYSSTYTKLSSATNAVCNNGNEDEIKATNVKYKVAIGSPSPTNWSIDSINYLSTSSSVGLSSFGEVKGLLSPPTNNNTLTSFDPSLTNGSWTLSNGNNTALGNDIVNTNLEYTFIGNQIDLNTSTEKLVTQFNLKNIGGSAEFGNGIILAFTNSTSIVTQGGLANDFNAYIRVNVNNINATTNQGDIYIKPEIAISEGSPTFNLKNNSGITNGEKIRVTIDLQTRNVNFQMYAADGVTAIGTPFSVDITQQIVENNVLSIGAYLVNGTHEIEVDQTIDPANIPSGFNEL